MFYYYMDPTYILVLIGVVICMAASSKMNRTFQKYSRVRSHNGMTGREAAERILHSQGIYDVRVEHVSGNLTDHYDPRTKVVKLSDSVYDSTSVAALGVAAHECGHVIQHHEEYLPLRLRTLLVPAANFGSKAGIPIILLGILFGYNYVLVQIGIWVFALAVLFQLVTLPVEFNASHRALKILKNEGMLDSTEVAQARQVLTAAAMTYVAALAASILQLLRLVILAGGRRDD